ncbi:MAG: sensor histidine kinase [Calditrichia bacterium]
MKVVSDPIKTDLLLEDVENIRGEERKRLAVEIHDVFGQLLGSAHVNALLLKQHVERQDYNAVLRKVDQVISLVEKSLHRVKDTAVLLHTESVKGDNILEIFERHCLEFTEESGVNCKVECRLDQKEMGTDLGTTLFCILLEGLRNVSKHANASAVNVTLSGNIGESIILEIRDNGDGISSQQTKNPFSLGIWGMKYRANRLGGSFSISSGQPMGTNLRVALPWTIKRVNGFE